MLLLALNTKKKFKNLYKLHINQTKIIAQVNINYKILYIQVLKVLLLLALSPKEIY